MEQEFSEYFWGAVGSTVLTSAGFGFIALIFTLDSDNPFAWAILATIVVAPIAFYYHLYKRFQDNIERKAKAHLDEIKALTSQAEESESRAKIAEHKEQVWKATLIEKTSGFPTLFELIGQYDKMVDDAVAGRLLSKLRPAPHAAEEVKEQSRRRREAEKKQRITQEIIEFYENLEPSLIEYKNEEFGDIEKILEEWTEEEKADPVSFFVHKDEYRKLSETERNQLALERYWKRPHSNWHVGIMYERYVGYLYEKRGYQVNYQGAKEGKKDLGRDLIATKGNEIVVIQCKNWSKFKNIFENAIFQFFGTVFQYKHSNKGKKVVGAFYTTTSLSDIARNFAEELHIKLEENFKMDKSYPCIKCNISGSAKMRIYHLPFDQQYDNVVIEPHKGEFYCATTVEAEKMGFRRAWRWSGNK